MRNILILVFVFFGVGASIFLIMSSFFANNQVRKTLAPKVNQRLETISTQNNISEKRIGVVATNLDTPWAIDFLPNGDLLVSERGGTIKMVTANGGKVYTVATIDGVLEVGEGGLLGLALHPNFEKNNYLYVYYTYKNQGYDTLNRVVRYQYKDNSVSDRKIIVDNIPGASNHNGGRIRFGPDKLLYITTGDAQDPSRSQNRNSLAGKILRVTDEGKPAPNNLFNSEVYSYGHRNPQGITWDSQKRLWATEHGRSGIQSGLDELNLIEAGRNYGWPTIQGDEAGPGMEIPIIHSGLDTWAPAGLAFSDGKFYFAGLRGSALYSYDPNSKKLQTYLKGEYGRLREAILGPDGNLYVTTSNRDGRGTPATEDDRILKINPSKL